MKARGTKRLLALLLVVFTVIGLTAVGALARAVEEPEAVQLQEAEPAAVSDPAPDERDAVIPDEEPADEPEETEEAENTEETAQTPAAEPGRAVPVRSQSGETDAPETVSTAPGGITPEPKVTPENGWYTENGKTYYYENGSKIVSAFKRIDGYLYYFDGSGVRLENGPVAKRDTMQNRMVYFMAKADGKLYENEWYDHPNGSRFYYGTDGMSAYMVQNVSGTLYYFNAQGCLTPKKEITYKNVHYFSSETGVAVPLNANGWTTVGSLRIYTVNDVVQKSQILQDGGKYYFLHIDGIMLDDNQTASLYDSSLGQSVYYRAKPGGALYVNEWYTSESGDRYYYGEGGAAAEGFFTLNGSQYYTDNIGRAKRSETFTVGEKLYIAGPECVVAELNRNGWTTVGSDLYYCDNGLMRTGLARLDGKLYYFEDDGRAFRSGTKSIIDPDSGDTIQIRARSEGTLYENEWYNGSYYYGANGRLYTGVSEIDGALYYLDSTTGQVKKNASTTIGGVLFLSDSTGKLYEMKSGWTKVGDNWYYTENNALVKNQAKRIGDHLYFFWKDGRMADDEEAYTDTYWQSDRVYYRAKPGGVLYENEWYEGGSSKRYYGADGTPAKGVTSVGDALYFFSSGYGLEFRVVESDGVWYVTDGSGKMAKLKANGWTKQESGSGWYSRTYWFYTQNGVPAREEICTISGTNYYFDSYGRMLDHDNSAYCYVGEGTYYIRAHEKGALYQNEWYKSENYDGTKWYYYGDNCFAVRGFQTIKGKLYYFSYEGVMATSGSYTKDGVSYVAGSDGVLIALKTDGWTKVDGRWFYTKDNVTLKGYQVIDGVSYLFLSDGHMLNNDYSYYNSYYYRAREGGALYVNEWYVAPNGTKRFYYGEEGRQATGLSTIDGKQYYFDSFSGMLTSQLVTTGGSSYIAGPDGVLTKMTNGWYYVGGSYYYSDSGTLVKSEVRIIDGKRYAFLSSGAALRNAAYSFKDPDSSESVYYYYYAKDDCSLAENTWVYVDSKRGYFGDKGKAPKGLATIDGVQYYFESGWAKQNTVFSTGGTTYSADVYGMLTPIASDGWTKIGDDWYYTEDGSLVPSGRRTIDGKEYLFYQGKMLRDAINSSVYEDGSIVRYRAKSNGVLCRSEWYQDKYGDWYYYGDDCKPYSGLQTVNGKTYYFYGSGYIAANQLLEIDGVWYQADANGKLTVVTKDGWLRIGDVYYYIQSGKPVEGRKLTINGKLYFFDYNGRMLDNARYTIGSGRGYQAKPGGELVTNQWFKDAEGYWYYYDQNGENPEQSIAVIGGKTYYFLQGSYDPGYMVTNALVLYGGRAYYAGSNGVCTEVKVGGWTKIGDQWYYLENADNYFTGVKQINGKWYYFRSSRMLDNNETGYTSVYISSNHYEYYYYRAQPGGVLYQNAWYTDPSGERYYYGADRAGVKGVQTIGGVTYYFANDGRLLHDEMTIVDGTYYLVGSDGRSLGTLPQNGWVRSGSGWLYREDGQFLRSCMKEIDGVMYYFPSNGVRLTNGSANVGVLYGTVRAGADGALLRNAWYQGESGSLYYYGDDYKQFSAIGWQKLDGKWYYFGEYGAVRPGWLELDGKQYYLNPDGSMKTGWLKLSGKWYHFSGKGELQTGWQKISGKWYYFHTDGVMKTGWQKISGKWYCFNADGVMQTGWQKINSKWYYFESSGAMVTGWKTIGGKTYFFKDTGVMAANEYCEGYRLDADGVWTHKYKATWKKNDKGWWFGDESGWYAKNQTLVINGVSYTFDAKGYLI